jgi:hypothetical protein
LCVDTLLSAAHAGQLALGFQLFKDVLHRLFLREMLFI